jgi:predicted PurR-regulated permease PerM
VEPGLSNMRQRWCLRGVKLPLLDPSVPGPGRSWLRDFLLLVGIAAGLWVTYRLGRIVIVLILAMFVAYVIGPLVERAQTQVFVAGKSRRLPRGAAVAVVYLLLAGVFAIGLAIIWPLAAAQLEDAIVSAPKYAESFRVWEGGWSRYYERLRIPLELRHGIDQSVLGANEAALAYARGTVSAFISVLAALPWLALIPILAFLWLKDDALIRRTLLTALPHRLQLRGHRLFEELNATLAAYVRAQLIACVIVGVLCGGGLALLGNRYAILLGLLAAVLEFIPLIGPFVVAVVAVGITALHDPMLAVWTAAFLAVLRGVEDYVIYPRLIGRGIHMHPLVIILAVLAGAEMGGVAGILIAVPAVALATVVWRHWRGRDEDNLLVAPHNPNGPLSTLASAHVCASIPNFFQAGTFYEDGGGYSGTCGTGRKPS